MSGIIPPLTYTPVSHGVYLNTPVTSHIPCLLIRSQAYVFEVYYTELWTLCTAEKTALFWLITQRVVLISYRRFGTNNRSHPRGSRIQNVGNKLPLLAAQ